MPALRDARSQLATARRDVLALTKSAHAAALELDMARSPKGKSMRLLAVAEPRAALGRLTKLLRAAERTEVQARQNLAKVIASEAAKAGAATKARMLSLLQEKQQSKAEADLQKALAAFCAAWKKRRAAADARKLRRIEKKAALKEAQIRKKANAKAKAAVDKAAALTKAGARKLATKARARAVKLKVRGRGQV
jgi:hypothetical protein